MVNKEIIESSLVFNARKLLKMTTADAGQLLGVTRRTWEMWESGKVAMPFSKVELFLLKLQGKRLSEGSFIVVISPQQTPLAVVAQSNFCGIEHVGDDNYIMRQSATSGKYFAVGTWLYDEYGQRTVDKLYDVKW